MYSSGIPLNTIFIIHREYKLEDLLRPEVATNLQLNQKFRHCLLYKLAGFQSFQETFFIKMDLSREEAETAIKQYSKEHYFFRLNRPRRIKTIYSLGIAPDE